MSLQSFVAKLRPPVHDLVSSATRDGQELGGQNETDQKEVIGWIEKTSQGNFVNESNLKDIDSLLTPKTYIAANYVTAADVALYGELHPFIAKLSASEYYAVPSLTRYFDHIQSLEKAPKKREERKKQRSGIQGHVKTPAADEGEPVPSMIDLRVGHIIDVIKHPDADGLYIEQIDLGEETGPRTVVSGLVHYIPIEQMRDKWLVAVCNLKPANMRGVKSFAMVLAATSKDGKESGIELIQPPANSKPGDRVYFEGQEYENAVPLPQLNPKKKIFETVQPGFTTLDSKEAAWINPVTKSVHKIRTEKGVCAAPTLVGASLS
ncbi:hypothetical protein CPB84DRAFT_1813217 [Gymnopilus junonius]|uniref:Nucleic acid-binding protein n=1 Tax=Gymnopilus junonius TaxID=109634 RepID=A0A9P5NYF7_GYMJU|nr:hypothetical protein CPB84DRAFT_1813217 [Gymnopilus junonius]